MEGYDLKYQSDFYNLFGRLVSVKIYKENYGESDVIMLRSVEVIIEVNYQDEDTPIIGTGAKINIINEEEFSYLNDLLTSYEKQFYCTIEYNNVLVFQGWSLCDLNEQQFIQWARITIQFVDYLHRLEDDKSTQLASIKNNTSIINIVRNALCAMIVSETGFGDTLPLYVNSTLFETTMDEASDGSDTVIEQTYVENNAFYSNATEYEDTYTVINKILLPLGAFFYSYGDRWIIERLDDMLRAGSWVYYSDLVSSTTNGASIASLRQTYNKQDEDFEYKDTSQLIEYRTGLQKLEITLNDKILESYVFNDFDNVDNFTSYANTRPTAGDLDFRKWYYYSGATLLKVGKAFRGINLYVKWLHSAPNAHSSIAQYQGVYYSFEIQFNQTEDTPTSLDLSFKMTGDYNAPNSGYNQIITRCMLIVDGGSYTNYRLGFEIDSGIVMLSTGEVTINTIFANNTEHTTGKNPNMWTTNQSLDLTTKGVYLQTGGTPQLQSSSSIWNLLGNPTKQRFIVCFFPLMYRYLPADQGWDLMPGGGAEQNYVYEYNNYLGDIQITSTQENLDNRLTYFINKNFINTGELTVDFWDLDNINYCNGYRVGIDGNDLGINKTKLWTSESCTTPQSLMDILAKSRYRRYFQTVHVLKGTILCDAHIKPFSVLTDDNLLDESTDDIQLLISSYSWDLNNGTYDIEAIQYTDENIVIDLSEENPATPSGITAVQNSPGAGIFVSWSAAENATSYTVERSPMWYSYDELNEYWAITWTIVYEGIGLSFGDEPQEEGFITDSEDGYPFIYRITSHDAYTSSTTSVEVTCIWYPA